MACLLPMRLAMFGKKCLDFLDQQNEVSEMNTSSDPDGIGDEVGTPVVISNEYPIISYLFHL